MAEQDRYQLTIERYLRERGQHEMPPGLVEATLLAAEAIPQDTGSRFWPVRPRLAMGSALLAAAIVAVIIMLQLDAAPVGDAPSATPRLTPTVSASAEPTPTTLEPGLSAGEHARVAVESIEARHQPLIEADIAMFLTDGDPVYVVVGPVGGEGGAVWYRVQHPAHRYVPGFVWVSFESPAEGNAALAPFEPRCAREPVDMELFEDLTPMERLLCFGDDPITIGPVHVLRGEAGEEEPTGEPGWLTGPAPWELYTSFNWPNATTQGSLSGRIEPGSDPQLTNGSWVELVGRFDHPDAIGCLRQFPEPAYEESAELSELWCRQQFVIIEVTVVPPPPQD